MNPAKLRFPTRLKGMMLKLPFMITCERFDDFMIAYFSGDLPVRQRLIFDMHIKVCRECRDYLRAYRASIDLAKGAFVGEADQLPAVPDDLVAAVLDAMDQ